MSVPSSFSTNSFSFFRARRGSGGMLPPENFEKIVFRIA